MKKNLIIFCLMVLGNSLGFSQITIRDDVQTKPVLRPEPYDSLSRFAYNHKQYENSYKGISSHESIRRSDYELKKYIGHKIFFIPYSGNKSEYQSDVTIFHDLKPQKVGKKEWTDIYKPELHTEYHGNLKIEEKKFITPLNAFQGKYFTIVDFEYGEIGNYSDDFIKMYLRDENGDTLFMTNKRQTWNWRRYPKFILVSYYEKYKKLYTGKDFVFKIKPNRRVPELVDINTGEIITPQNGDEWQCLSLDFIKTESIYLELYFVFSNSKGQQIKVRIRKEKGDDNNTITIHSFIEKNQYLHEQELARLNAEERERLKREAEEKRLEIERQRIERIKSRYGERYSNLILNNKVILGMSKEMCLEAWGLPLEINKTIVEGLTHEQWVYSLKHYLYFENSILVAIQN